MLVKQKKKYILLIFALCLLLFSCEEDIDNAERIGNGEIIFDDIEASYVAPLINTRTTLAEIEEELAEPIAELEADGVFLSTDLNDQYFIRFDSTVESGRLNEFYEIPTTFFSESLIIPQDVKDQINSLPVGLTFDGLWDTTLSITIQDPSFQAQLELIELSQGDLDVAFSHNINQDLSINVTMTSVTDTRTGDTLKIDFNSNPSTSTTPLTNHSIDLLDETGNRNRFQLNIKLSGTVTNANLIGEEVNIDFTFGNFFLEYLEGLVREVDVEVPPASLEFDLLNDIGLVEGLRVANPIIEINAFSTLGMPARMGFNTLEFGYPDGSTEDLILTETFSLNGVQNRSDIPNNPNFSRFIVNRDNSRIDELITTSPNALNYDIDLRAGNGTVPEFFFLSSESIITADIATILPLDCK